MAELGGVIIRELILLKGFSKMFVQSDSLIDINILHDDVAWCNSCYPLLRQIHVIVVK